MTNRNISDHQLLRQIQEEILNRTLPDVICFTILTVVGVLGNVLAAVFYTKSFKRTTTLTLIIILTFNDFFVCLLFIPNIIQMVLNVNNSYSILCKVTHFLNQWLVGTSYILLCVISIDRYRRICKPFGKQIKRKALKCVIPCIMLGNFCLALRKIWDYDTFAIDIPISENNITGLYCTNIDDPEMHIPVSTFFLMDAIFASICWIVTIVAYSNAVRALMNRKQKKKRAFSKLQAQTTSRELAFDESESFHTTEQSINTRSTCKMNEMNGKDYTFSQVSGEDDSENIIVSANRTLRQTHICSLSLGVQGDCESTYKHTIGDRDINDSVSNRSESFQEIRDVMNTLSVRAHGNRDSIRKHTANAREPRRDSARNHVVSVQGICNYTSNNCGSVLDILDFTNDLSFSALEMQDNTRRHTVCAREIRDRVQDNSVSIQEVRNYASYNSGVATDIHNCSRKTSVKSQEKRDCLNNHSETAQKIPSDQFERNRDFREFINLSKDESEAREPVVNDINRLERSLTFMMFTASAFFFVSLAPFYIVKLHMLHCSDTVVEYEFRAGIQLALCSPLLNSVFTPIIYCIFNSKFRQFMRPKCCKF